VAVSDCMRPKSVEAVQANVGLMEKKCLPWIGITASWSIAVLVGGIACAMGSTRVMQVQEYVLLATS
jgi:hypothetical protein